MAYADIIFKNNLPVVPKSTSAREIVELMHRHGACVIKKFLSNTQVEKLNREIAEPLHALDAGSKHEDEFIKDFHGKNTKRLTNLVTHSATFRDFLDDDTFHSIGEELYRAESGDWWLTTAQVIEIGPGNAAQLLHRDVGNFPPFAVMGKASPNVFANLMLALTPFTEQNGATRIIPGSQDWDEDYYASRGTHEMTIAAEMEAGDALLFGGKVVHGGGANVTRNEARRGLTVPMQPSYLTPEEAYPLIVDIDLVRPLSPRAQRIIGFRSQYPAGTPGLWQNNYEDVANFLKL